VSSARRRGLGGWESSRTAVVCGCAACSAHATTHTTRHHPHHTPRPHTRRTPARHASTRPGVCAV
jgi:hypothetical protein